MAPSTALKRRWTEDRMRGKAPKEKKRFKKQRVYYSSSEDEDEHVARDAPRKSAPAPAPMPARPEDQTEKEKPPKPAPKFKASIATKKTPQKPLEKLAEDSSASSAEEQDEFDVDDEGDDDGTNKSDTDASEDSENSDISEVSTNNPRRVKKRNDPEAFATSISKILGTKLTSQKRSEPILSRSKSAQETNKSLSDHKLTLKAHRQLLVEKKAAQEKGRVKDVLGLQKEDISTADIVAEEKRLRRTAQKGVIKLFNAVRAAQVKAEQAEKESKQKGVVGLGKRAENVQEMSKQGFLDMIAGGGKKKEASVEA